MAKKLQLRGGTTSEHSTFTGAVREVTVDTTKDSLVVHDGTTAGGIPIAKSSDITLGTLSVTADAAELNKLDGVTASTAELNHLTGVTSNIQTQLGTLTTGLGNVNTDLVNDTTPQLGGDLDLNGNSILGLNSSNLSSDFTVEAGKTISTGDVVNYAAGKIGDNPVVNTQTALNTSADHNYTWLLNEGKVVVKNETNGAQAVRTGVIQADGSINWNVTHTITITTRGDGTGIQHLGLNRFMAYADGYQDTGGWTSGSSCTGHMIFFSVNQDTGAVSQSNQITSGVSGYYRTWVYYRATSLDPHTNKIAVSRQNHNYNYNNIPSKTYRYYYDSYTFTDTGGISTHGSNGDWHSSYSDGIVVAGGKMLGATNATTWHLADWNGTNLSNHSASSVAAEAELDTTYNYRLFRPNPSIDKWLMMYVNSSLALKIDTYAYSGSTITRTNSHTVTSNGAGVSLGNIVGTTSGIIISYENDSKGYIATFTIDSTSFNVTDYGIPIQHNGSNAAPILGGLHNTNKVTGVYNTAADRVVSGVATVNAYATTPLNWLGVASSSGSAGDAVSITLDGVAGGFSGLIAGTRYYYNTEAYDSSVRTTPSDYLIGTAISSTEIKLNA